MINVTAATGQLGNLIVESLLETVSPAEIAVTVRTPENAAQLAEAGVSVRQGDYGDRASMVEAFADTDTLMLISGDAPVDVRITQHRNAIDAAKEAGVKRVVYTSFLDERADSPFTFSAIHADTETYLQESGLEWTILRPSAYAELNVDSAQRAIEQGVHYAATGDAKVSYISRGDIARAAASALVGSGHAGKIYKLTGPDAMSQPELVQVLSEISGKEIAFNAATYEQFGGALNAVGLPDFMVDALVGLQKAIVDGRMAVVTNDVEQLTGTPAESGESFIRRAFA